MSVQHRQDSSSSTTESTVDMSSAQAPSAEGPALPPEALTSADCSADELMIAVEVVPALEEVRRTLKMVDVVLVTSCLALQSRNQDFDKEVADALRAGARLPLGRLVQRLDSILGPAHGGAT